MPKPAQVSNHNFPVLLLAAAFGTPTPTETKEPPVVKAMLTISQSLSLELIALYLPLATAIELTPAWSAGSTAGDWSKGR